jgi:hypothetical protein
VLKIEQWLKWYQTHFYVFLTIGLASKYGAEVILLYIRAINACFVINPVLLCVHSFYNLLNPIAECASHSVRCSLWLSSLCCSQTEVSLSPEDIW